MEKDKQANNTILKKLQESIEQDADAKVLKYANQYLHNEADEDVLECKILALIKLEKFKEALHLQNSSQVKKEQNNYLQRKYLYVYTQYKLKEYGKALKFLMDLEKDLPSLKSDGMEDEGQLSFGSKLELLKAQILIKNDDFVQSSDILARFLTERFSDPSCADIIEDICANFFNSVTLLIWVHYSKQQPGNPLSKKREEAFTIALNYCLKESDKITIREVYLNLLITLAVLSLSENPYFEGEEVNSKFEKILELFYEKLDQNKDGNM